MQKFHRCQKGSVLILFTLSAFVLIGMVGLVIDYGRAAQLQASMQDAADAAALATALDYDRNLDEPKAIAEGRQVYTANTAGKLADALASEVQIDILDNNNARVSASATVETYFMRILRPENSDVTIDVMAEAGLDSINRPRLEVVFVFDESGSMNTGSRIADLRVAARQAVDILFGQSSARFAGAAGAVNYATTLKRVLPLSQDIDALRRHISALTAGGRTNIYVAVDEARFQIDSFTQFDNEATRLLEVMILMTDGIANTGPNCDGSNDGNERCRQAVIEKCQEFTQNPVNPMAERLIFAVAFSAPAAGIELMRACASEPQYFFQANSSQELNQVYQEIARIIDELIGAPIRLVR